MLSTWRFRDLRRKRKLLTGNVRWQSRKGANRKLKIYTYHGAGCGGCVGWVTSRSPPPGENIPDERMALTAACPRSSWTVPDGTWKLFRVSLHRRGSEECTRRLTWSERRRPEGYRGARTATAKVTTAGVQQAFVPGKHERTESTAGCEARPVRRESRRVRRNRWVENFVHEVDSISRRSSFLELNSRREDENF